MTNNAEGGTLEWGVIGTGVIAKCFAKDLVEHGSGKSRLSAVLSRSANRAAGFGAAFGLDKERCFSDMVEFLASGIDVCYIATPHTQHAANAIECLSSGVHVLVEKPLALSRADAEKVFEVAKDNNLFAMEALWTRFIPGMQAIQSGIASNSIGRVMSVDVDFGFDGRGAPERLTDPKLGGGSLFDLGSYALHLATMFLPPECCNVPPQILHSECKKGEDGIDVSFRGVLLFPTGKEDENIILSFRTCIEKGTSRAAVIRGEDGVCLIQDPFHCPEKFILNGQSQKVEKVGWGLHYQVLEVEKCVFGKKSSSNLVKWEESMSWAHALEQLANKHDLHAK